MKKELLENPNWVAENDPMYKHPENSRCMGSLSVYIPKMPKDITHADVRTFFSQCVIKGLNIKPLPVSNTVFVEFADPDSFTKAFTCDGRELKGAWVNICPNLSSHDLRQMNSTKPCT